MGDIVSFNLNWLQYNGNVVGITDRYNPLGLPPFTMRFYFGGVYDPTAEQPGVWKDGSTWTRVPGTDFWDYTHETTNWASEFSNSLNRDVNDTTKVVDVIGANVSGVTKMNSMFYTMSPASQHQGWVTALRSVCLFDTRDATAISAMFYNCDQLSCDIPDFPINTGVTSTSYMFFNCRSITGGMVSMYNKLSSLSGLTTHDYTFYNTGADSVTGSQELAQIPSDWK